MIKKNKQREQRNMGNL